MFKQQIKYLLIFSLCLLGATVQASEKIQVQAINDFNSLEPAKEYQVKVVEDIELKNGVTFKKDAVINGKILDIIPTKRGKRGASFIFKGT